MGRGWGWGWGGCRPPPPASGPAGVRQRPAGGCGGRWAGEPGEPAAGPRHCPGQCPGGVGGGDLGSRGARGRGGRSRRAAGPPKPWPNDRAKGWRGGPPRPGSMLFFALWSGGRPGGGLLVGSPVSNINGVRGAKVTRLTKRKNLGPCHAALSMSRPGSTGGGRGGGGALIENREGAVVGRSRRPYCFARPPKPPVQLHGREEGLFLLLDVPDSFEDG